MKTFKGIFLYLLTVLLISGCASSKITARQEYQGTRIARPAHILVYDFAAPPTNSAPQTSEQIATSRRVGTEIASTLADEIRAMGLPAKQASHQTQPQLGDLVIKGNLLALEEGSAAKRIALGFGSGAAELKAAVEGYLMTNRGLQKLGSGTTDSSGGKSPGAALGVAGALATANPAGLIISTGMKAYGEASGSSTIDGRAKDLAKEIAKVLQNKFKEQGWI
jgi:hypothetical protein